MFHQPRLIALAVAVPTLALFAGAASAQVLGLEVDPATGAGRLYRTPGPAPLTITGYQIDSPTGQLTPDSWNSLQDQGLGGFLVLSSTADSLAEVSLDSYRIPNAGVAIGNVFSVAPFAAQDLTLSFSTSDSLGATPTPGVVTFASVPEPATAGVLALAGGLLLKRRRR